jgi:Ca2+-binding EF-hand superfamily protein
MRLALTISLLCAVAACLPAAGPPAPPRTLPGDAHDLVLLHPARPYRLRLHLQQGRKAFHHEWAGQMAVLFAHLDTNRDGVLSQAEARLAPSRAQWEQMTRGEMHIDPDPAPAFADLAAGKEKIAVEQVSAYYRDSSAGPLQLTWAWRPPAAGDPLGDTLFRLLDTNRDGKLSRAELEAAHRVLARLDVDEDEIISQGELMGQPNVVFDAASLTARGGIHEAAKGGLPMFSCCPDQPPGPLVQALLARYDRDKNGKLSAAEIGLPADLFRKLDSNGDGQLDAAELARWFVEPADVELIVPLERRPNRVIEVVRPTALPVVPMRDGLTIVLDGWAIDVTALAPSPRTMRPAFPRPANSFRALDVERKGYLDEKTLYRPPFTYVSWLRLADRDGDGRLTEKEFDAFASLQKRLQGGTTFVRVEDQGQSLFRLLDADRDGRLGPRELRSAWQRLSRWDRGGKGFLSRAMLPRHYRITVGSGQVLPEATAYFSSTPRRLPARGPLWFRKMDRNGDGDVSLSEWLGTREQFDEIDTDRDGLISLAEAEAYDRRMRAKKE